jgi:signal transduction histidine kinase
MAQALANLISNAAKFSPKGGTVTLSANRKNGWVRICVADKGEGIPESFRDRIFSRFAQADSTDARQKGGSGLGLSITKAIAEAHSGKVGFTTAIGKGTTFFIDLPIISSAAQSDEAERNEGSAPMQAQAQPSCGSSR